LNLVIRKCTIKDLSVLCDLSRQTFDDTFRHLNTTETMAAYLDTAFDPMKLQAELGNKDSAFYFLYADDCLAGYLKLNEGDAQTDLHDPRALEIERIYVKSEFQGQGLGHYLIEKAVEAAVSSNKAWVWLGVWEKNEKAIAFYKRHGFEVFGTHTFIMGDEAQNDYVMRKNLI
jgi:ribosomal protein S18 acetylase RimI-like enzyme